jgi:hypothetical protein
LSAVGISGLQAGEDVNPWQVSYEDSLVYWLSSYTNGRYTAIVTLLMEQGADDGTVILFAFD